MNIQTPNNMQKKLTFDTDTKQQFKGLLKKREFKNVLEFGAGGSTTEFLTVAKHNLVTVENDWKFLCEVGLSLVNLQRTARWHPLFVDTGPVEKWGYPANKETHQFSENYFLFPFNYLSKENIHPDFVFVDGRFRVACALCASLMLSNPFELFIDDYAGREHYWSVEIVFGDPVMVGRAALFKVDTSHLSTDKLSIKHLLSRYQSDPR